MKKMIIIAIAFVTSTSFAKTRTIAQEKGTLSSAFALNLLLSQSGHLTYAGEGEKMTVADLLSGVIATGKNESSQIENHCVTLPKVKNSFVSNCDLRILLKWDGAESSVNIKYQVTTPIKDKITKDAQVAIIDVLRAG